MTRQDRLRRVVLLCAHFIRNMAYYRAGHDRLARKRVEFWITVDGNFIDMAVIEWCKLLCDRNGKHYWAKVVSDPVLFKDSMLCHFGMTGDELGAYLNQMRIYRDKFVAHLDDLTTIEIPFLDRARKAVEFYHRHVVRCEAVAGDLAGLPLDLVAYYDDCHEQAQAIYDRCVQ